MEKERVKKAILKAVENDPRKEDILKVSLFGSFIYGHPRADSDVDVLIELNPSAKIGFFEFFDIRENMEKYAGRRIDLLTPESISHFFRDKVIKQSEVIYEGK